MYCSSCGIEVAENHRYCPQCGTSTGKAEFISDTGKPARFLSRPRDERKIAGVCSGIARYIGIDVTLVRILFLVFAVWPPTAGVIVYVVCWIVMPQDALLLPPPRTAQAQNVTVTP